MGRSISKALAKTTLISALVLLGLGGAAASTAPASGAVDARIDALEARIQRLDDIGAINKLTRAYGYYVDKKLWDQVVDLFSADCRIEIAGRGVYKGRTGADELFRGAMGGGSIGLKPGALFNHMILQGVVDVAPDGLAAKGRWRAFVQIAQYQKVALWSEGTYENDYLKQGGVWKISGMHFYSTYYTPFDKGWALTGLPNNGPSQEHPPAGPPSITYDVFPGHYVPPFHYANPVTGRPWTLQDTARYSTHGPSSSPADPKADADSKAHAASKTESARTPTPSPTVPAAN